MKIIEKLKKLFKKHHCTRFKVHSNLYLLECEECGSIEYFHPHPMRFKNEF